jgi:hypothetical protein
MKDNNIVILGDSSACLPGVKAAVMISNSSRNFMADHEILPLPVTIKNKKFLGIVPGGENNTLQMDTISKIYINLVVSSGIEFNIRAVNGDGFKFGPREIVKEIKKFFPAWI